MFRSQAILTALAVLAAVVAAGFGLWSWLTLSPGVADRVRDDAFYEFVWAANVAAGEGPTVSAGVTTSGVQWLWSLLLVPFAWLFGAASLPTIAPALGLLLHVAGAGLWFVSLRDRVGAWCLSLCWLGHPLLLREAQNGQETALACLLTAALVLSRYKSERRFVALCVLAALARTELLALVFTLSMCRSIDRPWRAIGPVLLAAALPFSLNLAFGGGLLPDSAGPMSWLWHTNQEAVDGSWSGYLQQLWWYLRPALLGGPFATASVFGFGWIVFRLVRPWWPKALRAVPAVAVGCASALGVHDLATPGWAALLLVLFPANSRRKVRVSLLCVVVGLSAIVVLHWPIRWYPRDYYLAPLVVAAFYGLSRSGRFRLALLALAVVQVQDSWRVLPEPLRGQLAMELAGQQLHAFAPSGERVGSFNSGLVTYHADALAAGGRSVPILNLDGVVDRRAFAALQDGALARHLDEQGVRLLLDSPAQFSTDPARDHACGRYFGGGFEPARDLVELARFVTPSVAAPQEGPAPQDRGVRLYWRAGRGERPAAPVAPGELRLVAGGDVLLWGARAGDALERMAADGSWQRLFQVEVDTVVVARRADGGAWAAGGLRVGAR